MVLARAGAGYLSAKDAYMVLCNTKTCPEMHEAKDVSTPAVANLTPSDVERTRVGNSRQEIKEAFQVSLVTGAFLCVV